MTVFFQRNPPLGTVEGWVSKIRAMLICQSTIILRCTVSYVEGLITSLVILKVLMNSHPLVFNTYTTQSYLVILLIRLLQSKQEMAIGVFKKSLPI